MFGVLAQFDVNIYLSIAGMLFSLVMAMISMVMTACVIKKDRDRA
ncbi:hypothetical protein [Comamonas sp. BIGb0124]|nr:hypothetical protein [Comamonas sp. BIGb0124]